jgi:hypothetical protein
MRAAASTPRRDAPGVTTGQDDQGFHERVQALFLRAVEQQDERRAAWLEQACAGDVRLRDEVASLLRHHRPRQPLVEPAGPRLLVVRDVSTPAWTRPRRMLLAAIAVLALLGVGGVVVQLEVRKALFHSLEDHLVTLRQTGVVGLEVWMGGIRVDAEEIAADPAVAAACVALTTGGAGEPGAALDALAPRLDGFCARRGWRSWCVVGIADGRVLAAGGSDPTAAATVGRALTPDAHAELARVSEQGGRVIPPHATGVFLEGDSADGPPVITAGASVRRGDTPVAAVAFQIPPEDAFARILGQSGPGQGETIAFDRRGRLLSHSAYEEALAAAGQLGGPRAMLHVELRDPGVDLLAGGTPAESLVAARPLTEAARHAIAGQTGAQVEPPYRSYTGQLVVGAWTWLREYDFGVATEIPVEQAYAPLYPWRHVLIGVWALLGVFALALGVLSVAIRRLRERVEELAELGQYQLDSPLGAGGMGTVYLARHALLRRPTAVKVLRPEQASDDLVRRFEQEVQQTARLSHPNTIEIYDYGRTPERVFYYAMEYADGLTLDRLVALEGRLPAGRAAHLLRQLCGSLAEAHARGLVHRDVKPQNVLVCERGGLSDFVKVLDFGLVKATAAPVEAGAAAEGAPPPQTTPELMLGTLLYVPPERLRGQTEASPRGDVYALGATAFRMLTGRDVFSGATSAELCANILSQPPPRLTTLAPDVPRALEALVLACLSKEPGRRPANAGEVLATLEMVAPLDEWTPADARAWWERYRAGGPAAA